MKDLTNIKQLSISEEIKKFNDEFDRVFNNQYENTSDLKINCLFLLRNISIECYREQFVSYSGLHECFKYNCPIDEADWILYMHPYARIDDASWKVKEELEFIDSVRKPDSQILVLGKSANIEKILNGKIKNIIFIDSHFADELGKMFNLSCHERYFVYDDRFDRLNIWPVDGCLSKCSFCRRCYMDIKFESLRLETIKENLDFIKKEAPDKMKHISLRAENLTEYGLDLYSEQRLQDVLLLIASYPEVETIEIPIGLKIGEITDEILDVLCECKKITRIALNVEAGSDRLLSVINKGQTVEQTKKVLGEINRKNPNVKISSTIMIGLPTEELIDMKLLTEIIAEYKIDSVLCNYYGRCDGHPIAKLPQLTNSMREYHLKKFLSFLKDTLTHDIIISFPHIFRNKNKRYKKIVEMLKKSEQEDGIGGIIMEKKEWKKVK